jgi:hypothetical protein
MGSRIGEKTISADSGIQKTSKLALPQTNLQWFSKHLFFGQEFLVTISQKLSRPNLFDCGPQKSLPLQKWPL